jgi:hypothetical protein
MREAKPSRPLQVTQWDPQTGAATNVVAPSFLDEGAGKFWQPMLDGVRDIVVRKRGWPERLILLGSGSDIRPSQKAGAAVRQWAPYARWNIYSHFSGDPGAFYKGPQLPGSAPGKFIALGGLEVGLKELPNGGIYSAAQLEKLWQAKNEYIEGSVHRGACNDGSGPMVFRTVPMHNGSWARVGIDFWPGVSRYYAPVWGTFPARVAARGPDGPVPTVRLQMMREALQDFEARMTILDALPRLPADRQNALRALLDDLLRRATVGERYLSQTEVGLDWYAYAARLHQAAAELSGAKTEATWDQPPK